MPDGTPLSEFYEAPQPLGLNMLVGIVMDDTEMLEALNRDPAKVVMSPDGTVAELSIAAVVPHIVSASVRALAGLGYITFMPVDPPVADPSQDV